jgi:plastocyanin
MTWHWRIFFSLALVWPAAAASVSGVVRLVDSRDPAVRKHRDYSGVVVWLEPLGSPDSSFTAHPRPARMEQKDKRFQPHVLAIEAGAQVSFPNFDPIFHSAFSNFSGQIFDLGLYAPGTSRTVTFTRTGIVRVFCNIHPTMSAVIVVLKYPWFAVSNAAGAFAIHDVPEGDYRLHLYHERTASKTLQALERTVTVSARGVALPSISISETGYVETPHKNKYGHDYPPVAEEPGTYPSSPR